MTKWNTGNTDGTGLHRFFLKYTVCFIRDYPFDQCHPCSILFFAE